MNSLKTLSVGVLAICLSSFWPFLTTHSQTNVRLNDRIIVPEIYFTVKLHDTILSAQEGFNFENYASVRFEVDKNGKVNNITFSTYTDSLVMPHLINVLRSTEQKWQITREGKKVRQRVRLLLPVIFVFNARIPLKGITNEDPLGHPLLDMVDQSMRMFQFSNDRQEDYGLFSRNGEKFDGIVLNPIVVRIPRNIDYRY